MSEYNKYDAIVAQRGAAQQQDMRLAVADAVQYAPDTEAKIGQLARQLKLPVEAVRLNLPQVQQRAAASAVDYDSLIRNSPELAKRLANPQFARETHDDVPALSRVEQTIGHAVRWLMGASEGGGLPSLAAGTAGAVASGVHSINEGGWGLAQNAAELLPSAIGADPAAWFAKQRRDVKATRSGWTPQTDNWVERDWYAGMESFGLNMATLPVAAANVPRAMWTGLGVLGAATAGQSYGEARDQGVPVGAATAFAGSQGAIEVGTERLGMPAMLGMLKPGQFTTRAIEYLLKEQGGEQIATHLQDLNEWAVLPANQGKTVGDYLQERPSAALHTALITAFGGGAQVGAMKGISWALDRVGGQDQQAARAEQAAAFLAELGNHAKASKTLARDAGAVESLVQAAAEGGPAQDVYISASALQQSGLAEALAEASPAAAAQMATAMQTGGDVVIPLGEYTSRVAANDLGAQLADHVRLNEDDWSRAEASTYMASPAGERLTAEFDRVTAQLDQDASAKAEFEAIRDDLAAQIEATGRHPQAAKTQATLTATIYANLAQRLGITPAELAQRYPLRVVGDAQMDEALSQGASIDQLRTSLDQGGVDHAINERAGIITLSRLVVPEDQRGQGAGSAAMQALIDYADRTGQHIALSPSGDFGGSKSRLVEFYKRFGFVENKGKNRAFRTSESMYRPAPGRVLEQAGKARKGQRAAQVHSLEAVVQQWQRALKAAATNPQAKAPRMPTPTALSAVGVKATHLELPIGYLAAIQAKHGDVPASVFENLPALLADPLFVIPYRDGGVRAFIEARTDSGEPIFVGIGAGADGRVQTISPLHDQDGQTGQERLGEALDAALSRTGRVYARNKEALVNTRASTGAAPATIALHRGSRSVASVVTRDMLVNRLGEHYYQGEAAPRGASENRAVSLDALALEGNDQAVLAKALIDRLGLSPEQLANVFERPAVGSESNRLEGVPSLQAVFSEMQRAVLDDPQVLDAVVGSVPIDVVNNLFGSERAAQVALHDQAVLKDSAAFDAELSVASAGNATNPVLLLVRQAAMNAAEVARGSLGSGLEAGERGAAVRASQRDGFGHDGTPRALFDPSTSTIALLKDADLSSFLHETGHFWLETLTDIASQIAAQQQSGASISTHEAQMLADANTALKWAGVADLQAWEGMTLDERREAHEQWARGFEAYLREGNAPSVELAGLFGRMRAWLVQVYKQLKELNVTLTDEVRGVMDRLVASDAQIALAEQARSLMPLFEQADQAGLSPEAFAAYQALGQKATAQAQGEFSARLLRDMAYARSRSDKALRRLQQESAAARALVRMDVRREVMSQPVYRAWQFLTGKLGEGDKLERLGKPAARDLDPTVDSLLPAIAKLGGISRESAAKDLGVHADYSSTASGVFGAPIFRATGGVSADTMVERLGEAGYMPQGQSLAQLEALIDAELHERPQYSIHKDYGGGPLAGQQVRNPDAVEAGRLDLGALRELYGEVGDETGRLKAMGMTAATGWHPELIAERFGFDSGDALVQALLQATPPDQEIEARTDAAMLAQHGELASPEAIRRAADAAVANDVRARFVATEAAALDAATGPLRPLLAAARQYAAGVVARTRVRDLRPGRFAAAEARAAKAAAAASAKGNLKLAASEKRNQLVNLALTRQTAEAREAADRAVRYLRRFAKPSVRKAVGAEYMEQIDSILERFDLRDRSLKAVDKSQSLAKWIESQVDQGINPDIPPKLLDEARRENWQNLSSEDFAGLVDSVRQIESLGKLKGRLLTAQRTRNFKAAVAEIVAGLEANVRFAPGEQRTATTRAGKAVQAAWRFGYSHIKAATWARIMDGGQDGGPLWQYLIRTANTAGDRESAWRAMATEDLARVMAPLMAKKAGPRRHFASINMSLTHHEVVSLALNMGNAGNLQRLLDGRGWRLNQVLPVVQSLTADEWRAVQGVWDYFETWRPEIAAKERRVSGVEPKWIDPQALQVTTADGQTLALRGGYYPIKYDPMASERADAHNDAEAARAQLKGAYTSATTRRSFTKDRSEAVMGRPLIMDLSGVWSGMNEVIHDLAWHEWLIDANRLLKHDDVARAMREGYGAEAHRQLKNWVEDVAVGDRAASAAMDGAIAVIRRNVSIAGLGLNVMSAAMQPFGITQSISRIGAKWVGAGLREFMVRRGALVEEVRGKSAFMANRTRTRFRELAELRDRIEGSSAVQRAMGQYGYLPMLVMQTSVDVPTWQGAYLKALADGNGEAQAVALADQAVIDSQGGGQTKDLSAIERGGPAQKLFTVFYSFMNTALNLLVEKGMTERSAAKLSAHVLLVAVVPALLTAMFKDAATPGDSGDDDWEKFLRKLLGAQVEYLMGMLVFGRELAPVGKAVAEGSPIWSYSGPSGLRPLVDFGKFAVQLRQGDMDAALRKATVNLLGDVFGLPSAQINRTVTGAEALADGKTANPAALVLGFQEPHK